MPWIVLEGKKVLDSVEHTLSARDYEIFGNDIILNLTDIPDIFRQCKKFYGSPFKTPTLTVDTIVKKKDDSFILIKRKYPPFKNHWALPGGFVEYDESVETAAIRETREETGLDVNLIKLVGVYSDPGRDPRRHTVSVTFLAEIIGGKLRALDDAKEVKLFKRPPEKLAFDHLRILKDAGLAK